MLNEFTSVTTASIRARAAGHAGHERLGVRLPIYPTLRVDLADRGVGFFNIGDNLEAAFVRNGFEWSNRTSWVLGRHSLQFGGEIARYRVDIVNEFRRAGHFVFRANITDRACHRRLSPGPLDSFDQGTGEYKNNRATYSALFFQDDFK